MLQPRSSRLLLVVVALVTALATAWWLLDADGGEAPAAGSGSTHSLPTEAEADANGIQLPDSNPIATSAFDANSDRADPAEIEEAPSVVLVRDAAGAPVADAEVTLLRPNENRGPFANDERDRPLRRLRTDAQGRAAISPLPRRSLTIQARTKDALGVTDFRQGEAPDEPLPDGVVAVVRLAPIKFVEVHVTDSTQTPVGHVRVSLQESDANNNARGGRGGGGPPFPTGGPEAWTNASTGVAHLELDARHGDMYEHGEVAVSAHLVGQDAIVHPLVLAASGVTTAHIETPPAALLVLHLVDKSGAPLKEDASLFLRVEIEAAGGGRGPNNPFTGSVRVAAKDGEALVGGARSGQTYNITASGRDRGTETCTVVVPSGIARHDAPVPLGMRRAAVMVTLHDADGLVVPWFAFNATLRSSDNEQGAAGTADAAENARGRGARADRFASMMTGGARLQVTDIEGRARISVNPEGGTLVIRAQSSRAMRGGGEEPALATVPVPALKEGGERDLGVVKLSNFAVLARGRVVDPANVGVAGISVRATESTAVSNAAASERGGGAGAFGQGPSGNQRGRSEGASAFGQGPSGNQRGRSEGASAFGAANIGSVDSGKDGVFKLYGPRPEGGTVVLNVSGRDTRTEPMTVTAGSTDVVLRLLRTGTLTGTVRLTDPTVVMPIDIAASTANSALRPVRARPDAEGRFVLRGLPEGNVTVRISVNNVEERSFENVKVLGAERIAAPELQNLVVGFDWRLALVDVRDPMGAPLVGARVQVTTNVDEQNRRRGGGDSSRTTDSFGRASFPVRSSVECTVTVSKPDFTRARFERAVFPLAVTLSPGLTVSMPIAEPPTQLGDRTLRLMLVPQGTTSDDPRTLFGQASGSATVRATDSSITFRNVSPGSFTLLGMLGGGGGRGAGFTPTALGSVTISATGAVGATIDTAALAALLKSAN